MRHLTAARKGETGGWHYVSMNRRGGHPLGYCADHAPHETEAEARECYGQYLRDNITLDGTCSWSSCEVKGCDNPARTFAGIKGDGYQMAVLCTDHLDHEHAVDTLQIAGPAGDAWES